MTMKGSFISTLGERIALISAIGLFVGTGVCLFAIADDWRHGALKNPFNYVKLAGVIVLPFLCSLFACIIGSRIAEARRRGNRHQK